ncbi:MAG: PIG-L family deacetylase [Planctomycetes bacterium]|nr:PIG-L family deacetylase [Planctomycetota bacterium]
MRVLVVVAHPDDETIWCGGAMLQHPDCQWTVLSLCRGDDPDRAPKFRSVCRRYGAAAHISDLDDSDPLQPIDVRRDIGSRILGHIDDQPWDLVLTHGANGEYGHRRHIEVHQAVAALVAEGALRCGELRTFAYECQTPSGQCRPADDADLRVELAAEELAEKKRIVRELYGFAAGSFEETACISPECFRRVASPGRKKE